MAAIFRSRQTFFTGCYTGSWIYQHDSHEFLIFWAFDQRSSSNIDGDISIYNFDLLCDLVTSSMTSWIRVYRNVFIISWYLCTGILMMISLLGFLAIMKNVVISFIKEYRGPTFRTPCDVIGDVIIMKNSFNVIIWDDFFISEVKLKLCLIFQFLKWPPFWARDNFFQWKWYRKLNMPER